MQTPAKMTEPSRPPMKIAVTELHQLRPKAIGSEPNTMFPKPNCGPNIAHARLRGLRDVDSVGLDLADLVGPTDGDFRLSGSSAFDSHQVPLSAWPLR